MSTLARNRAVSDALIVSAEEDLVQVIGDVQDLGVRVTLVHITVDGNWTISRLLRQECDAIIEVGGAQLGPYVSLIAGAEAMKRPGQYPAGQYPAGQYAGVQLVNGRAASGYGAHAGSGRPDNYERPPAIYTSPATAPGHVPGHEWAAQPDAVNPLPVPKPVGGPAEPASAGDQLAGDQLPGDQAAGDQAAAGHEASGGQQACAGLAALAGEQACAGAASPAGEQACAGPASPASQRVPSSPPAGRELRAAQSHAAPQQVLPQLYAAPTPVAPRHQGTQPTPYVQPQYGPYSGPQPATAGGAAPVPPAAATLADATAVAHAEGLAFGDSVARDAPALWLEAVLARKPRMPSDLEARLLQGSALPIDFLLHDEVRQALRRGFWDALERSRR